MSMSTTRGRLQPRPSLLFSLFLLLAAACILQAVPASPAAAQQPNVDCRCVDADGNPIENCRCFRMPRGTEPVIRMFGVARARFGVSLEEHAEGAAVTQVLDASPAQAAGLAAGDVITRLDGRSLLEPLADAARERRIDETGDVAVQRLMAMAQAWEVGTPVEIEYLRGTDRRTIQISPEENPSRLGFVGPGEIRMFGDNFRPYVDAFGTDGRARILIDSLAGGDFRRGFRFSTACTTQGRAVVTFGNDCVDGLRLIELNPELGDYFGTSTGVLVTRWTTAPTSGFRRATCCSPSAAGR
jgi:hypothetical protein